MLLDANGFTNEIDAFADRPSQLELSDKDLAGCATGGTITFCLP
jgi:hypothetical protein